MTHDTRDDVKMEILTKKVHEWLRSDGDSVLFDSLACANYVHHQLQKAREEERERILRSVNDKEKQEQILANLILRVAGERQEFEISDSDLLTDYVVFETRPLDRCSTIYRVERNRTLDHSELDQDTMFNKTESK